LQELLDQQQAFFLHSSCEKQLPQGLVMIFLLQYLVNQRRHQ